MHPDLHSWAPANEQPIDSCRDCGSLPWDWTMTPDGRVVCPCGAEQTVSDPGPDGYGGEDDLTAAAIDNRYSEDAP